MVYDEDAWICLLVSVIGIGGDDAYKMVLIRILWPYIYNGSISSLNGKTGSDRILTMVYQFLGVFIPNVAVSILTIVIFYENE